MDYARSRRTMVDNQVRPADVTDHRIIAALLEVPRERFVAPSKQAVAYLDIDVPVADDSGRVLLKPIVFGKLLQAAGIKETERVLDVGCATGYSAAVLARLAGQVVALEEDAALARAATANLGGVSNVSVVTGPLAAGSPQGGPYNVILLEGRSEVAPAAALRATRRQRPAARGDRQRDHGEGDDLHQGGHARDRAAAVRCRGARAARIRQAARIRLLTAGHYRCVRSDLPQV